MRAKWLRCGTILLTLAPGGVTNAVAGERWLEIRSPHFRVITNGAEADGRAVASGFEQLRLLFGTLGDMKVDPPAPIEIVAARDEAGLRSLVPWFWERRGGLRPEGVFLNGSDKHHIAMRLDVDPQIRNHIVYHEYVHLIARLNFTGLPLWLNEGLAEFFAATSVEDDEVVYGRVSPLRLAYVRRRTLLPLADLFAVDHGSREYNEESRASVLYAESALLTHYFLIGDRGAHRGKLTAYLNLLSRGASDAEAQAQAFGDVKALERGFFSYVRRFKFLAVKAPIDRSAAPLDVRRLGDADAMALRGEFQVRYGQHEDGRPLLTKARELDAGLARAAQALGLLETRAHRPAEARRHLAEAIRLAPEDFASHYLWAKAVPLDEPAVDLPATEAALRRALALNSAFAPAHALLASVLRQSGQLEPAFAALVEACRQEPNEGNYWLQRADLLRELKRPDVADAIEATLARTAASDRAQLRALVSYYRKERRFDDVERLLRRVTELNPRSAGAHAMLGDHLQARGRGDEAEAAFRSALAVQPENPHLMNALAYHNAERGAKLPEALKLIDRALRIDPSDEAMLDTKGWVLFRLGRLDEAESLIRRALERGDDADVLEHLGDVLDLRGQGDAARDLWRRALAHPDVRDERKEALQRKLADPQPAPAPDQTPAG